MKIKAFLFFLNFIGFAGLGFAQQITDANFAEAIRQQCPDCIDKNNKLTKAAAKLEKLDVSMKEIKTLKGFNFPALIRFDCENNQITTLPELPSRLEILFCGNNQLTVLPKLPSTLKSLTFYVNKIKKLPELPSGLEELQADKNQLSELPKTLPSGLISLWLNGNQITTLPEKLPEGLAFLDCAKNPIESLPAALPQTLIFLNTSDTKIDCIPNELPNVEEGDYPSKICSPVRLREVKNK